MCLHDAANVNKSAETYEWKRLSAILMLSENDMFPLIIYCSFKKHIKVHLKLTIFKV